MRRSSGLVALLACLVAGPAAGQDAVTVVSWGGAYEAAQRRALFDPFERQTGTPVSVLRYDGGLTALGRRAGGEGWQVVDMLESEAIAACDAGLLRRLDHGALFDAPMAEVEADFAPAQLRPCSVPQNVFATVFAYDERAFPGAKPTRVEDFFDLERLPGKRAIEKRPDVILQWALMAEGVPPSQVYDLLSTARGLELAFRKLDAIRDSIVWWEEVDEPARLLRDGEVAMASGYNGRFFAATMDGAPLVIVWDGRVIGYEVWAVPAATEQDGAAADFLRYALRPEPMARLASLIPYGPARRSALARVGLHADAAIPMLDHLPNAPRPDLRAIQKDSRWLARTTEIRERRFEAWLAEGEPD